MSEEKKKKQPEEKKVDPVKELTEKVAELTKERDELENKYLRSQAEIQNAQKRYTKEREQLIKYESQKLGSEILPAVDNLERALAVEVDDEAAKQLKKGVEMTLELLVKSLKDQQIEEISASGEKFDPALHQAVQTIEATDEHPKDTVVQVLQKGYRYKDRTLRPAMVVVAQ
ncbi:MAG: nucleotide exchange factor GrpE [Lactobacillus sp.]|nr:nucleotide exchange factor GrpE [Lactobacillus sp.]